MKAQMSFPNRLASRTATYRRITPRVSSFFRRSETAPTERPTFSAISDWVRVASAWTSSRISRSGLSKRSASLTSFKGFSSFPRLLYVVSLGCQTFFQKNCAYLSSPVKKSGHRDRFWGKSFNENRENRLFRGGLRDRRHQGTEPGIVPQGHQIGIRRGLLDECRDRLQGRLEVGDRLVLASRPREHAGAVIEKLLLFGSRLDRTVDLRESLFVLSGLREGVGVLHPGVGERDGDEPVQLDDRLLR